MSQRPLHCGDRSGFLFAHACDHPPAGACSRCGKPICVEHTRTSPTGPTCISCLRDRDRDRTSSDSSSSSSSSSSRSGTTAAAAAAGAVAAGTFGGAGATGAWTGPGEGGARDDPYFYGGEVASAAYYDADDFRAFDATVAAADAASAADAPETDTGAS
jgi:hypothetical protein